MYAVITLSACLQIYGIHGTFLDIFKSMYGQLKSRIKINGGLSRQFECTVGTRQGCVSLPVIISLFINDLVKYIRQT